MRRSWVGGCDMRPVFASSAYMRTRGLIGRQRSWLGRHGVLVFAPCRSLHTFGMRCPLDMAFLAPDGTVLYAVERVYPRRVVSCAGAAIALERFSQEEEGWLRTGDRVLLAIAR